jgi:hypothetical protein
MRRPRVYGAAVARPLSAGRSRGPA